MCKEAAETLVASSQHVIDVRVELFCLWSWARVLAVSWVVNARKGRQLLVMVADKLVS